MVRPSLGFLYGSGGEYLVPELLGKEEPELQEFAAADVRRFEYHYNILPEGLLPRFIVRSRGLNKIAVGSGWQTLQASGCGIA